MKPPHGRSIGTVFTPLKWAKWLVGEFGIADRWIGGATVCDPTAGDGAFALALVECARERGVPVDEALLGRIVLIEREERFLRDFALRFEETQGIAFPPDNLIHADVLFDTIDLRADILTGNPPWINFTDLDAAYKEAVKPLFIEYGLVTDRRGLLLGSSRIDLAALVIFRTIESLLAPNGEAVFFIPLSLFLNDGAHTGFRRMRPKDTRFSVERILDFGDEPVFESVTTRYGAARFLRDHETEFPVPYRQRTRGRWLKRAAAPLHGDTSPLSVLTSRESLAALEAFEPVAVDRAQLPRQGVNTCGANDVFIFDTYPSLLPEEFVFPLVGRACFERPDPAPSKYILLPYDIDSGRPLSPDRLMRNPRLREYLNDHREKLMGRKGTMLGSWIRRGIWWALLGAGPYCFAPYKLVWEAFGKTRFIPVVLSSHGGKPWQANQAMHCFIPHHDRAAVEVLLKRFREPAVKRYLLSMHMAGTRNWAQPGRIRKLLRIGDGSGNPGENI
jgi:hypothetical protein